MMEMWFLTSQPNRGVSEAVKPRSKSASLLITTLLLRSIGLRPDTGESPTLDHNPGYRG